MLSSLLGFITIGLIVLMIIGFVSEIVEFAARAACLGIVGMLVYGFSTGEVGEAVSEVGCFVGGIFEAISNLNLF